MDQSALRLNISKSELLDRIKKLRAQGAVVEHHPLGFFRLPLTSLDRLHAGFYLHVWPRIELKKQNATAEIHNHVFDLESRLLAGAVMNIGYSVAKDKNGNFFVANVLYRDGRSARITTQRRVRCQESSRKEYEAGDTYKMKKGIFHETLPTVTPAATLMRKSKISKRIPPLNLVPVHTKHSVKEFVHRKKSQASAWRIVINTIARMRD